jgi:hypothetical protein
MILLLEKKTYLEIEVMVKNKPYLLTTLFKNLESKAMPQVLRAINKSWDY